jgi:hypothetical protein
MPSTVTSSTSPLTSRLVGGGDVELSGNSAEQFDDLIKKHGKILCPNHALVSDTFHPCATGARLLHSRGVLADTRQDRAPPCLVHLRMHARTRL